MNGQAGLVKTRIQGALSDLHAADARYHENCKSSFMAPRSVNAAANSANVKEKNEADRALQCTILRMSDESSQIWNTVTAYDLYTYLMVESFQEDCYLQS